MKALVLALKLAGPAQDDVESLVRDLGDYRIEVRDAAMRKLEIVGRGAYEALLPRRDDADPEIRERVRLLLFRIEMEIAPEKRQRPNRLRLVSVSASNASRRTVLEQLQVQTGIEFSLREIDAGRCVSLDLKHVPLSRALHKMGLAHGYSPESLVESAGPAAVAYVDGGAFTFERNAWAPKGETLGFVLRTQALRDLEGDLEWDVAKVRTPDERRFQTCAIHSPGAVYVEDPALPEAAVTIRGLRRWYCETPIEFRDPVGEGSVRVGAFLIAVDWPRMVVRSDQPIPKAVLSKTLSKQDITVKIKPEHERRFGVKRVVSRGGGGWSCDCKDRAWCGCCLAHGADGRRSDSPPATRHEVKMLSPCASSEIESISIRFHKPVEERFEVTSPALK